MDDYGEIEEAEELLDEQEAKEQAALDDQIRRAYEQGKREGYAEGVEDARFE